MRHRFVPARTRPARVEASGSPAERQLGRWMAGEEAWFRKQASRTGQGLQIDIRESAILEPTLFFLGAFTLSPRATSISLFVPPTTQTSFVTMGLTRNITIVILLVIGVAGESAV